MQGLVITKVFTLFGDLTVQWATKFVETRSTFYWHHLFQKGGGTPSPPSPTTPKQSVLCRCCPRYLRWSLRKLWLGGRLWLGGQLRSLSKIWKQTCTLILPSKKDFSALMSSSPAPRRKHLVNITHEKWHTSIRPFFFTIWKLITNALIYVNMSV